MCPSARVPGNTTANLLTLNAALWLDSFIIMQPYCGGNFEACSLVSAYFVRGEVCYLLLAPAEADAFVGGGGGRVSSPARSRLGAGCSRRLFWGPYALFHAVDNTSRTRLWNPYNVGGSRGRDPSSLGECRPRFRRIELARFHTTSGTCGPNYRVANNEMPSISSSRANHMMMLPTSCLLCPCRAPAEASPSPTQIVPRTTKIPNPPRLQCSSPYIKGIIAPRSSSHWWRGEKTRGRMR